MPRTRTAFILGAALLVVAIGLVLGSRATDDGDPAAQVSGFHRLGFGQGTVTVELDAGTWVGYYEAPGFVSSPAAVPNFRAFIRDSSDAQINVGNYPATPLRYTYQGKSGLSILQFDAPQSGKYRIELQGVGQPQPGTDLALGRDLTNERASPSRLPIVIAVLAGLAGVALLGWGLLQRSRRARVVGGAS